MRKLKINGVEIEVSDDCTIYVEGNKITIQPISKPYIPVNIPCYRTVPFTPPLEYPWTYTGNTTQDGNY